MPKISISIEGVVIKEVQLSKDRTTLGRRPYNDIVIDNLAVSGEHALLEMRDGSVTIEDRNSTNGTFVNGMPVKRQPLQNGDQIEVGKYRISFMDEAVNGKNAAPRPVAAPDNGQRSHPLIKVLTGVAVGRELEIMKDVTTVGKPGVAVTVITRRPQGYMVSLVEGIEIPLLNGSPITSNPSPLRSGDLLEVAGTRIQFLQ